MSVVWRCGKCRTVLLTAKNAPGGPELAGHLHLVDLPAGRFVDERGRSPETLTSDTLNPTNDMERERERPHTSTTKVSDLETVGPLIACPCGHIREHRIDVSDVLTDLRSGRRSRDLFRSTRVPLRRSTL